MSIIEIARAMYSKEKDSLDKKVTKDIQIWAGQCSMKGMLTSGGFLEGVWEREEERARKLCRTYWETAIDLAVKQNGKLATQDIELIERSAQEVIESELAQAKTTTFDWVNRAMPNLESLFTRSIKRRGKAIVKISKGSLPFARD